jgi:uncharacterized protein with ParB-like and HNH nuclease domain
MALEIPEVDQSGFGAAPATLRVLFSPVTGYEVPPFQRGYSWKGEEIDTFLDDITEALAKEDKGYFLGALVLLPLPSGRWQIIDGQQRLATITMVLAALRNLLFQHNDDKSGNQVQQRIWPEEFGEQKERLLRLRSDDDFIFLSQVQKHPPEAVKSSRSLILPAFKRICAYFSGISDPKDIKPPYTVAQCLEIIKFIQDKLRFVMISVSNEISAFTVFETLNERGLDLATDDLLRNYVCSRVSPEDAKTEILPP